MTFLTSWQFWVVVGFIICSATCKAVNDKLLFHFDKSVFRNLNSNYWNPSKSWQNKYNISNNRFISWLFQNPLVLFTDAWDTFEFLRNFFIFACISVISGNYWLLLLYFLFTGVFHLFFTYIFKIK